MFSAPARPQMRCFASLQIILTTSAHYNKTKKVLHLFSVICFGMGIELPGDPCELAPAVPSPPPYQLHRDNRLRSQPPHFALTATLPPYHHLSQSKCGGLPPPLHRVFGRWGSRPAWDNDAAKNRSKAAIVIGHTGSSNYRSTSARLADDDLAYGHGAP